MCSRMCFIIGFRVRCGLGWGWGWIVRLVKADGCIFGLVLVGVGLWVIKE